MESEIEKMKMASIDKMSGMLSNLIAEAINYSKIDDPKKIIEENNFKSQISLLVKRFLL